MAENQGEVDPGLQTPEVENRWDMFYTGIENNMIFVHGTSTIEKRSQILNSGLKPPSKAVSSDTLARNVQFSTFERYSGSDGYIFVFRLDEEDIKGGIQFINQSRTFAIGKSGVINQDKIVLIIPKKQSRIFDTLQEDYRLAIEEPEFSETDQALDRISEISRDCVARVSVLLVENCDFVNGDLTKDQIHKLSQEIVWNQLVDSAKCAVNDLDYYSRELFKCGSEDFMSFDKMIEGSTLTVENWENVRKSIEILKALGNQEGSGLDNINLIKGINLEIVEDFINWKEEKEKAKAEARAEAEKMASMTRLQKILYKLKSKRQTI